MTVQQLIDALQTIEDKQTTVVRYSVEKGAFERCRVVTFFKGYQRRDKSGCFDRTENAEGYNLLSIT